MRSASHLGTCPPCSGRLAVPALRAIERPLKMQRLYSAADNRHLLQRRLRRPEPLVTMKRQPGTAELASMNLSANMTSGIGQPVRRKEDFRLLTGRGSFADDIHLPELAHAVIVRSPHAHAHIESIDKAAALASPGVLKVSQATTTSPTGSRRYLTEQASWADPMSPSGSEASIRSRRKTTRCRPIRPVLSARRSLWSSPRPSIRPRTQPS